MRTMWQAKNIPYPQHAGGKAICIGLFIIACLLCWWLGPEGDTQLSSSEILRNLLLALAAVLSFPFIVWRAIVADRQVKVAAEESQRAQRGLENDIYIKAVEQLASDKESIRLAAVHSFVEILKLADERGDKAVIEKILSVGKSFMESNSKDIFKCYNTLIPSVQDSLQIYESIQFMREGRFTGSVQNEDCVDGRPVIRYNDYLSPDSEVTEKQQLIESYLSQFSLIIRHFFKEKYFKIYNLNTDLFSLSRVWLRGCIFYGHILENIYISGANFTECDFRSATIQNSTIEHCDMNYSIFNHAVFKKCNIQSCTRFGIRNTSLKSTKFLDCNFYCPLSGEISMVSAKFLGGDINFKIGNKTNHLDRVLYNSAPYTDPDTGTVYQPTQFPTDFDPKAYGMIDVSAETPLE